MRKAVVASSILLSMQIAKASEKAVITHPNCQLVSSALSDQERRAKGYAPAMYKIINSKGGMLDYTMGDTSNLVGPFVGERVINQENELKASLESLHISKIPTIKYYDENGKELKLKVTENFNHAMSFAVPEFPLNNAKKMYFEIIVSVDKATLKNKSSNWAYLTKMPVFEKVIFKSKVFSFSEVAKNLLESNQGADEVLSLLVKNDPKEILEITRDSTGAETMNFVKMLLIESVRAEAMNESEDEGNLKLLNAIAEAIPNCEIKK